MINFRVQSVDGFGDRDDIALERDRQKDKTMLVIFDKDGTLVRPKSGAKFVNAPDDQELIPGVAERIDELVRMGATMAIASNQGGVAAGHKSLDDAIAEMKYCFGLLPQISSAFFCPDFDGAECWRVKPNGDITPFSIRHEGVRTFGLAGKFRKPDPGMLELATRLHQVHGLGVAVMIGDRPEDAQAAQAAGITFVDAEAWRTGQVQISPEALIA